ncbi:MFS transporter [Candidatus Nanohalococcus occultus]|uniref:MFS transporter n=1 Tax=Candidatus Nanohalococcus occultus TaxID=2978047 RepID=UPI0039DFC4B8
MEFDKVPAISKYLSVIFLFGWLGRSTVWNFLPVYFEQHITSVFLIGVLTSLPAIIPILIDIPVGNLVQRAGERIVLFTGLIVSLLSPVLYLTAIPAFLILGKVSEGLTKALVWNSGWSLNLKSADPEYESESISVFFLGMNLAIVIGPIIGGFLIASNGFKLPFYLWMFTTVLGLALYYVYVGIATKKSVFESLKALERKNTYVDDWQHLTDNWERLKQPFVLVFLYSIIFSFYWLAIPLLLNEINASYPEMGIVFGLALVPKLFQFAFGEVADKIGNLNSIKWMSLFLAVFLAALSQFSNLYIVAGLFFFARLLSGGMSPPIHSFFDSRVPDELEGEMMGFFELFKHIGQAIGPIMAGAIADVYGVSSSFLLAAVIAVAIAVTSFIYS